MKTKANYSRQLSVGETCRNIFWQLVALENYQVHLQNFDISISLECKQIDVSAQLSVTKCCCNYYNYCKQSGSKVNRDGADKLKIVDDLYDLLAVVSFAGGGWGTSEIESIFSKIDTKQYTG